jgi:hypothetical protein
MNTRNYSSIIFLFIMLAFLSQSCKKQQNYHIAFYNVENLFDTINSDNTSDTEFTPQGKVPWTSERYNNKKEKLASVIAAMNKELPDIFGMCEVENINVVKDLITTGKLQEMKYGIVHYDSPDERGIDVALLYNKCNFNPLFSRPIPILFPFDSSDRTRDILYVKGLLGGEDSLHIFINHWPSRWGGQEKTAPARNFVAGILKKSCDSIFAVNKEANIIIMGDFNDNPTDESLAEVLHALMPKQNAPTNALYNLMLAPYKRGEGSYYYSYGKEWNMLDQIIVSGNLLKPSSNIRTPHQEGKQILRGIQRSFPRSF